MKKTLMLLVLFTNIFSVFADSGLQTTAEKSSWVKTGNAQETEKLCLEFQRQFPKDVKCLTYGVTPEKRKMFYMVIGDTHLPIVWVQAGIHAGEIDGKDAVFWLLRDILEKKISPSPLKGLCLVFIPIVNLDGHERIGKWNRPNQIGPEEMGWRTTSQNFNLNRDFMKADAPEMRDLLKIWHKMNPAISLDLHVTDGAQFQPEVGLIVLPNDNHGTSSLHQSGKAFELDLLEKMKQKNRLALPFYPSFEKHDDPLSGVARYVATARFSHGYWFNNNRLGMLVETHSWKNYANRVQTHRDTVLSTLEIAQVHAKDWSLAGQSLDKQMLAGKTVDLEYKHTEKSHLIDFPGYKFTQGQSLVSGEKVIKYEPSIKEVWSVPFYEELSPSLSVEAPELGYFIQAQDMEWLLPKLKAHAIEFKPWTQATPIGIKVFRATKTEFSPKPFEGHQTLKVEGQWENEEMKLSHGSIFIPINQAKGRVILQLFEPMAQDSFLAWGFFNRAFEQKEYMENYVAEDVATEMLKNPEIRKEFESKLQADADFAKDPEKRFEFFYRKHPSWDERFNKYPIFKK